MLLFRPPLLKFGLAGVLPANFATGGDFDSPLVNDAVSPDDDNTEFLWALLTPLIDGTSGGTTDVDDLGFYGHVGGADGTYLQDYRVLKMPPTGAVPAAEEATITVNIGSGGASLDLDPATLALSGALSIGGDIQIGTSFDLASDPVALSGSLAVSGDIESSVDPILDIDAAPVALAGSLGVSGDIEIGTSFDLAATAVALAGSIGVTGDIEVGTSFDLAADPVALSGALAVSGDIASSTTPIAPPVYEGTGAGGGTATSYDRWRRSLDDIDEDGELRRIREEDEMVLDCITAIVAAGVL